MTNSTGAENLPVGVSKLFGKELSRVPALSRTPLRARQTPIRLVDAHGRVESTNNGVPKPQNGRRRLRENEDVEPELPPTPVQLGLDAPPEKPRGLASSSPRSGSGRSRSRLDNPPQTSSPLKPRRRPADMTNKPDARSSITAETEEAQAPGEAPESDAEQNSNDTASSISEAVINRRFVRDSLSAQLARLQSDLSHLEAALPDSDNSELLSGSADTKILSLLTTSNLSCDPETSSRSRSHSPSLRKPTALGSNPLKYLTLFAPGNMQLHSTTTTAVIDEKAHQVHTLELTAPDPFPRHVFGATLAVQVDVENKQIKKVKVLKLRGTQQKLKSWAESRLHNPLHQFDVGGLIWGLGRWWEECVRRAQGWRALDRRFRGRRNTGQDVNSQDKVLTPEDVRALLPFIEQATMRFDLPEPKTHKTRAAAAAVAKGEETDEKTKPQLLLEWGLELDWVGETDEKVDISIIGWGPKAQAGIKEAFQMVAKGKGVAVFAAMEVVWGILERPANVVEKT